MRKLSVFYEHILQACEQSGKTIPEVLAFCREQGISAVEMNYSLFASEREVIAPMLSDAGLVISCMHETFDFSHDTDLGRAQQMLDTAASQQVSRVLFVGDPAGKAVDRRNAVDAAPKIEIAISDQVLPSAC